MIKWIFFDVGSTLVDETQAYDHRVRDMICGTNITFEMFDDVRTAYARKGLDGNSQAIMHFGLSKTPWHSEDEIPYADARDVLEVLCERGYKLGIIANQNPGLEERLSAWGLYRFFDVIASSSEIGFSKPGKEIFEKALELAGCAADQSCMVGDRLDNDIIPAKALGMKTIWVKRGLSKVQMEALGKGIADFQVGSLKEILHVALKTAEGTPD